MRCFRARVGRERVLRELLSHVVAFEALANSLQSRIQAAKLSRIPLDPRQVRR